MIITTGRETLERLITRQLENNFLLDNPKEHRTLRETLNGVLPALERCFQMSSSWYYHGDGGEALFDPYHTCQYGIFLYFLSRAPAKQGEARQLAAKVYAYMPSTRC